MWKGILPPMNDCLARILTPVSRQDFLRHYGGREYLHINRNDPAFYAEFLTAAGVDRFLACDQLPAAFLNVVRDGKKCPIEAWSRVQTSARGQETVAVTERLLDLYGAGATLILNRVHLSIPGLRDLCADLTSEFGFLTQANVYLSPPGSAGFDRHADEHEVIVMQIAGSKHWQIFPGGESVRDLEMRSGDLLFLPRGLSHAASTSVEGSILVNQIVSMAKETADLGRPAPPAFADQETRRNFDTAFRARLTDLLARVTTAELLDRYYRAAVKQQPQAWPGRFSDLCDLAALTADSRVSRRRGILTHTRQDGRFLNVEFGERTVVVPAFLRGALDRILGRESFAVRDLEGLLTDAGKIRLVREFVRTGLLQIEKL
jgi:hypothetical protein